MKVDELAALIGWDTEVERPRRVQFKYTKCGNKGPALTVAYDRKPRVPDGRH
jgi:hypothetical protein